MREVAYARRFGLWAAFAGATGVALGAFAAHGLRGRLDPAMLDVFETGVRYHMYHALALWGLAAAVGSSGAGRALVWAGRLFAIGILIFSGSLYALALTGVRGWGAVTPIGGVAFIAGWIAAAAGFWRLAGAAR